MSTPQTPENTFHPFRLNLSLAMQHGIVLGLWSILAQIAFFLVPLFPFFSLCNFVLIVTSPLLLIGLARRCRDQVIPFAPFSLFQASLHAYMTQMCALVWSAIALFIVLNGLNLDYLFDYITQQSATPEMQAELTAMGVNEMLSQTNNGETIDLVGYLRSCSPTDFTIAWCNFHIFIAPLISLIVGLFSARRRRNA